jgi:hypothetical protein
VGLIKQAKVDTAASHARRAREEGRKVFVGRIRDEVLTYQGTGSISGAAEAVEAIEAEGWRLVNMAYSWVETKKRGLTVCLFRSV